MTNRLREILGKGKRSLLGAQDEIISAGKRLAAKCVSDAVTAAYYDCDNFGDQLTPEVISYFGYRTMHLPSPRHAELAGTGSILHFLPEEFRGAVLGSGQISEQLVNPLLHADIRLVRGDLTRKALQAACERSPIALGDPGLLARNLYTREISEASKKFALGIIPHYTDADSKLLDPWKTDYSEEVAFLNVRCKPVDMAVQVAQCEHVVSSSLHGLVFADSLGVPNRWLTIESKLIGGDFKFNDYYSALDRRETALQFDPSMTPRELIEHTTPPLASRVEQVIEQIQQAYEQFFSERG